MAYDAVSQRHILLGAQFIDDPHTWAYDLAKNEWIDLKPKNHPPYNRNDPVLAFDERSGVVVASVRAIDEFDGKEVTKGHFETWVYDGRANDWKKMNPEIEPPGGGNRRRLMVAVPDQNVILMENYVNPPQRIPGVDREQQIWTYRYAETKPEANLAPPTDVRASSVNMGALVAWTQSPRAIGYEIQRGISKKPWLAKFEPIARTKEASFRDETLKLADGELAWYAVVAEGPKMERSAISQRARFQPRLVFDVNASVISPREVRLTWSPSDPGPIEYFVERAVVEVYSEDEIERLRKDTPPLAEPSVGAIKAIGPFVRLNKVGGAQKTFYTDREVDLIKPVPIDGKPIFTNRFRPDQLNAAGKPYRYGVYAYRVIARDNGVESGPGPYVLTIPSSPQWVFSKEEGTKCRLKWAANAERDLQGYRVYRMESPRINGPGQKTNRLTADPIREVGFLDEAAGKVTRRYWIVAVDALGQEGFPSAPAWHEREHKRFYLPFTGEWHQ